MIEPNTVRFLRVLIAGVLFFAATLKSIALLAGVDKSHDTLPLPYWLTIQILIVEFLLAGWLLSGWHRRLSSAVATILFSCFLGVSVYSALQGKEVCGCFGFLAVSPWLVALMDLCIVVALIVLRPKSWMSEESASGSWRRFLRPPAVALVMLSIALVVVQGIHAHLESARFYEKPPETNNQDIVNAGRTLTSFLTNVGVPRPLDLTGDNVDELLQSVFERHELPNVTVEKLTPEDVTAALENDTLATPVLLQFDDGELALLLSKLLIDGVPYYQLMSGSGGPQAVNEQRFKSTPIHQAWHCNRSGESGVTYKSDDCIVHVDRGYHNFGNVLPLSHQTTQFHITNRGPRTLTLNGRPTTSCGCTKAEIHKDDHLLEPGQSIPVLVSVHAKGTSVRYDIHVNFIDPTTKDSVLVAVEVLGSQLQSMTYSPKAVDFGYVEPSQHVTRTIRISEATTDRFRVNGVDSGQIPITHTISERINQFGLNDYLVELTLSGENLQKCRDEPIRIITDSSQIPSLPIDVTWETPDKVTAHPKQVAFGTVPAGQSPQKTVKLTAPSGWTPTIHTTPDGFDVEINSTEAGEHSLIVTCTATTPGSHGGEIVIHFSSQQNTTTPLAIKCGIYVRPE